MRAAGKAILFLAILSMAACIAGVRDGSDATQIPLEVARPTASPTPLPTIEIPHFEFFDEYPIIKRGAGWDSAAIFPGDVFVHDGILHMFYTGSAGQGKDSSLDTTGYAISVDGIEWHRTSDDPIEFEGETGNILGTSFIGSVYQEPDGTWVMFISCWVEGEGMITGMCQASAQEPAGPWTIDDHPVLLTGPNDAWDGSYIFATDVIKTEQGYYMYYSGIYGGNRRGIPWQQIGLATSQDGVTWIKYNDPDTNEAEYAESDPVFSTGEEDEWASNGVYFPAVMHTTDGWVMIFVGAGVVGNGMNEKIGIATSEDGIHWAQYEGNPVFSPVSVVANTFIYSVEWVMHDGRQLLYFALMDGSYTAEIYLAISE